MTVRRIIAPVTFAPDTHEAVAVAAGLAAALGAELVLAGIAPSARRQPLLATPDVRALARQTGEQVLVDRILAARLEALVGAIAREVDVRTVRRRGSVGAALLAAAREERADLLVVPMRRENELAHLIHDHADRYVLLNSDVPVLVVPTDVHGGADALYEAA